MLVKSLPHEELDDGLPADIELTCSQVQFLEHVLGEVDIYPLNGWHDSASVSEEAGNVATSVGSLCNGFGGNRSLRFERFLHRVFALPWLLSTA
jgi:hypothetical protein